MFGPCKRCDTFRNRYPYEYGEEPGKTMDELITAAAEEREELRKLREFKELAIPALKHMEQMHDALSGTLGDSPASKALAVLGMEARYGKVCQFCRYWKRCKQYTTIWDMNGTAERVDTGRYTAFGDCLQGSTRDLLTRTYSSGTCDKWESVCGTKT